MSRTPPRAPGVGWPLWRPPCVCAALKDSTNRNDRSALKCISGPVRVGPSSLFAFALPFLSQSALPLPLSGPSSSEDVEVSPDSLRGGFRLNVLVWSSLSGSPLTPLDRRAGRPPRVLGRGGPSGDRLVFLVLADDLRFFLVSSGSALTKTFSLKLSSESGSSSTWTVSSLIFLGGDPTPDATTTFSESAHGLD